MLLGGREAQVERIKLAVAWRQSGDPSDNLGARVGVEACRTYEKPCLSCAMFGSA